MLRPQGLHERFDEFPHLRDVEVGQAVEHVRLLAQRDFHRVWKSLQISLMKRLEFRGGGLAAEDARHLVELLLVRDEGRQEVMVGYSDSAKEIGRLDIGQSVMIKDGAVVAVECDRSGAHALRAAVQVQQDSVGADR